MFLLGEKNRCILSEVELLNTWEKDLSYIYSTVTAQVAGKEGNLIDSCIGPPVDCSWAFATNRQAL